MPDSALWILIIVLLMLALGLARKVVELTQRLNEVSKKPGNDLRDASLSAPGHTGSRNTDVAASVLSPHTINNYLLKKLPETLQTDFDVASEIWLVGASLGSTINEKYSLIE